jgi:hypothetical protein
MTAAPIDACNEIFRRFPGLKRESEGRTTAQIVENFVRAFSAAEQPRRDPFGEVNYGPVRSTAAREPEPKRHALCRCTAPPKFCRCAGAGYDEPDAERDGAIAAELRSRGRSI